MVKLYDGGIYLVNGAQIVADPAALPATSHSRHHGGGQAAGWTQVCPHGIGEGRPALSRPRAMAKPRGHLPRWRRRGQGTPRGHGVMAPHR